MKDISFETALEKLEKIVSHLEEGDLDLEKSLKSYEEGIKLASMCQKKLDEAKGKIEELIKTNDGFSKKEFKKK